ncbi:hypothetical protein [Staphylococcus hominis]|nr:hypothetical protein [Staphylococcus hominis]
MDRYLGLVFMLLLEGCLVYEELEEDDMKLVFDDLFVEGVENGF